MKRIVSLFLASTMIFGMLPQSVLAAEVTEPPEVVCSHQRDDSCYAPECTHVHDDSCGYAEAAVTAVPEAEPTPEPDVEIEAEPAIASDEEIGSGTPDGTPPVLHGMTMSSATVTAPGTVEITVEASDDVSGVEYADISFKCDDTEKFLYVYLTPNEEGELCGTLTVDQYVEPGIFYIHDIRIEDSAENRRVYWKTPEKDTELLPEEIDVLTLEVIESEKPDGTPPVLYGVTLSATTVTAPGTAEITVDARDDVSGLFWGDVCFRCESTKKTIYADLTIGDDGKFHGTLNVNQYVEPGVYLIYNIRLEDAAGNRSVYYSTNNEFGEQFPDNVKNLKIEIVESEKPDGTPPVLHGVTLSATTVTVPGSVEVSVEASDDVSGLFWGDVCFRCEETGKTIYADLNVGDDGKLHGTLRINQYVEPGRFYIDNIRLEDAAGNRSVYYSKNEAFTELLPDAVRNLKVDVLGAGKPDSKPPVLHNLELSATSVTVPDSLNFSWTASDDVAGVSGIMVAFAHIENGRELVSDGTPSVDKLSGTFSGTISTDQNTPPGEYVLRYIGIVDMAGNVLRYSENPSVGIPFPDAFKDLKFTVVNNNALDQTPPELKGISLHNTSMSAPGEIGITVDAIDEESALAHVSVGFYCEEVKESIGTENLALAYDPETGLYQGAVKADQYDFPGVYKISYIFLEDYAGNYVEYVSDPFTADYGTPIPEELRSLSVEITDSVSPDNIAPAVHGITFSASAVMAPGMIEMYLDASDENSGINLIKGAFYCEETDKYLDFGTAAPEPDPKTGKYHLTIKVNQHEPSGIFVLDGLVVQDSADNGITYQRNSDVNDPSIADLLEAVQFKVINRGADITTSVSRDTFVEELTEAKSDAYIAADYSGEATMPAEAFQAIAGTDKTIDLISEGITWRFEGSDITEEVKDIDLKVDIQKVEEDSSASGDAIEDSLKGNPGVVMKFPENGTLPGKATIQVKVDYAMREYLGSAEGLSVYYYNSQTGELELIASDLKVINDTYVEFPITHCSYYVLTTGPQADKPTEPTTPAETTPGDSPEPTTPEVPTEPVEALSGKCGSDLSWEFDRSSGVLTISGKGSTISNYTADKPAPWRDFVADITSISFSGSIAHIGDYAFAGCTGLTSVVLPGENYVYLGKAAFSGCTNLKEITFTSGISHPISGDTFAGVTAKVYFPAGHSWSESSQAQFGENLTWSEYGENAVMLSFYSAYLKVGETYTSTVEAHPAKATADCTFTVDDPSVLQIVSHDQKSVTYKGIKPGRTTVTVTDQNTSLSVSKEVLVYDSQEISLPYTESILVNAEPFVRSYTVTPIETAKYVLMMTDINAPGWDSSGFSISCNGEYVSVENWYWGEGIIRQIVELTAGKTYEILASSLHPELDMTATIELRKAETEMESIKLSSDDVGMEVSEDNLEWIGVMTYPLDSYVDRRNIQWSIKDTSIAEIVDSTEIECGFRAKKAGTTEITVSLDGFTDTATIHVYDTPTIRVGETLELSRYIDTYFQSITFIPEENGRYVFTINSGGLRVPNIGYSSASGEVYYGYGEHYRTLSVELKAGEVFEVEVYGRSFTGTSTITVNKATDTVESMDLVCTYNTPDRVEFGVQFTPATAAENVVKWEVSNPNLMGHSRGDGEPHNNLAYYTPYGTGNVTVTATSESGKTASCTLMVGQCLNGHSYSGFSPLLNSFGNSTGEEYRTCYRCDTIEQRQIRPTAASGTCGDNLTWTYSGGILTISGTGAMYDYSEDQTNPAPWHHLAGDIAEVIIEEGATSVGDYAFYHCNNLFDVFIPQSLTTIGSFGLRGRLHIDQTVRQWYTVEMGTHDEYYPHWDGGANFRNDAPIVASGISGKRVFWELNENGTMVFFGTGDMYEFWATASPYYELPIKNVAIGEGITNIGMNIFELMETDPLAQTLESVTVASTVKRVEEMAFAHCKALKTITFAGDAPTFGDYCFWEVTATAYYPAGNDTWTAAVMQDYEGDITWVPYCPEHSFGEWITDGTNSHRTCIHCGYTEHKVVTDSGDVEIEIPQQPDLEVEVDPVLPSEDNYVLVEETLDSAGEQDPVILKVFDINLKNEDGVHVQPGGAVKVKLPLAGEPNGNYKVYRVNEDGTLTDMNAFRQGDHMVFETDHFSLYVIVHSHSYQNGVCTDCGAKDPDTVTDVLVKPATDKIFYETEGQVVTVTHSVPCKVGYLIDGAYVAIAAVANADGSYSFAVPEGVTEVALVVKGDVNGDGKVNNTDKTRLNAYLLGKNVVLSEANLFASDTTGDGKLNNTDKTRMNAVLLNKTTLTW